MSIWRDIHERSNGIRVRKEETDAGYYAQMFAKVLKIPAKYLPDMFYGIKEYKI